MTTTPDAHLRPALTTVQNPAGSARRLEQLIARRAELASHANQAHRTDDEEAAELFALMIAVEDQIASEFPTVHAALFPRWMTTEAETLPADLQSDDRARLAAPTAKPPLAA